MDRREEQNGQTEAMSDEATHPDLNNRSYKKTVHGRKKGRPLGVARSSAVEKLFSRFQIDINALAQNHTLDPKSLFDKPYSTCWLEIGFGSGEHLYGRMKQNSETAYLGAEIFSNGVAGLLKAIDDDPADNVRISQNDGMILARSLAPESMDGIYVLNPDPWHKKRHHKRRLVRRENLDVFANILKPGGHLILSTDVPDLADWMITQTALHPAFDWTARSADDWQTPPEHWISTRYETKKAKAADKMTYLIFIKKQHKSLANP